MCPRYSPQSLPRRRKPPMVTGLGCWQGGALVSEAVACTLQGVASTAVVLPSNAKITSMWRMSRGEPEGSQTLERPP